MANTREFLLTRASLADQVNLLYGEIKRILQPIDPIMAMMVPSNIEYVTLEPFAHKTVTLLQPLFADGVPSFDTVFSKIDEFKHVSIDITKISSADKTLILDYIETIIDLSVAYINLLAKRTA